MAKLYAYNTSATQIKKRYAMIGSTATQVKKKYAMIGSTATLVYSAEEYIYNNGVVDGYTWTAYKAGNKVTTTDNTTNLYGYTWYGGGSESWSHSCSWYAGWRTNETIDFSQYSTLTVNAKVYTNWSTYNYVQIELCDNAYRRVLQADETGTTTTDTWTFDISDINDVGNIGMFAGQTYNNGRGAYFNLYSILLS